MTEPHSDTGWATTGAPDVGGIDDSPPVAVTAPTTGEPRVDAAIGSLAVLDTAPVTEHVGIFDDAHRQLQDALADLDEG